MLYCNKTFGDSHYADFLVAAAIMIQPEMKHHPPTGVMTPIRLNES
jgi:hypothetical protein